jgi:D-alanyl-D-alanine carboxypeptidase (penicillin-binding protein 5/6)
MLQRRVTTWGLVAVLLLGLASCAAAQPLLPPPPTQVQAPDTSGCPFRIAPPPPVDQSEAPAPGQPAPNPVPVPRQPVGGERLAECGLVLRDRAPRLPDDLTATSWVLADLDSGDVLAAKDPHGRHRPASTIKVLTALVALRKLDPATVVEGTHADAAQEGSKVGIGPGGRYTVGQLLQALLMTSGNDAAHALSIQLGGVAETVSAMNELAASAGALDTRAVTPSGLDGPGSSLSAYDLALLFRLAMRDPTFASIVGTQLTDFPGFAGKPGFKLSNDNRLLRNYPGALGGKTGFTNDARHTYVGAAERDGRRLVIAMLRGEQKPIAMWTQATRLLDYGFATIGPPAVGRLVESAPGPASDVPQARAAAPGQEAGAQPPAPDQRPSSRSAIVAALATLALLVAVATTVMLRGRRARARRSDLAAPP